MQKFGMEGMHADDISRILQGAGVDAGAPVLNTVQQLESFVGSPASSNSAIVMIAKESVIEGKESMHFVLVEVTCPHFMVQAL